MKTLLQGLCVLAALAAAGLLAVAAGLFQPADDPGPPATTAAAGTTTDRRVARGAYLARAGDCMACHTVRGGQPYAGGRTIETSFGALVTPNITPHPATGIGTWSADDFWRALHHGTGKNGRLLYPAFPYTNYTRITRDDADALYAWLRTLQPVQQANQAHRLRFPYNQQWALSLWRALYFRPGVYRSDTQQSVDWNRGAYLVRGLGHCSACHSPRNWLGADSEQLSGALLDGPGWYAPALDAGISPGKDQLVTLLKTGVAPHATVSGPMAEVVRESLQYLNDADLGAMATYLGSLPAGDGAGARPAQPALEAQAVAWLAAGARLYEQHCVACHGAGGAGQPPHYPPLAGNRALTQETAVNPIRLVLNGGFPPATAGNPRPYGMPPFGHVLDDTEVAQLVSYLRSAWNHRAAPVTAAEVNRYRAVPLDQ
ncbi:MAG: cytochrome c [Duganella sp.]